MKLAELRGAVGHVKSAERIRAAALKSIDKAARCAPQFGDACNALATAISGVSEAQWLIASRYRLALNTSTLYGTNELTIASIDLEYHQVFRDERFVRPQDRLGTGEISAREALRIKGLFIHAQRLQLASVDPCVLSSM